MKIGIVGAGILGLAHAYTAAKAGHSVTVFEKDTKAQGASIRNFGLIWLMGLKSGEQLEMGYYSRSVWLEVLHETDMKYSAHGSLHLAYNQDELDLISEFTDISEQNGYKVKQLNVAETFLKSPHVNKSNLLGSLFSKLEMTVDSRQTLKVISEYLRLKYGVKFYFSTQVTKIQYPQLITNDAEYSFDYIIVCNGADYEALFPSEIKNNGLIRCKLQMLKTIKQENFELGPSLAGGLTLGYYNSFSLCKTQKILRKRLETEMPEYIKYGIHVLASQNSDNEIIIGDSHEYSYQVDPFDKNEIEELIMNYIRKMVVLNSFKISERWQGIYSKHPDKPLVRLKPQNGVELINAPGGNGNTLSFAIAAETLVNL